MKFTSSVGGYITGLRFYKGVGGKGTHIGNLWSINGTNLASATFTNETSSGWQTVTLSSPVAITANTTYVVSYFSQNGDFVKTNFFTTNIVNGPLTGLGWTAAEPMVFINIVVLHLFQMLVLILGKVIIGQM